MAHFKILSSHIKSCKQYPVNTEELENKILLFVNVTNTAPNSKQVFEILTKLNKTFKKDGLRILSFPCFQFGLKNTREELVKYIKDNNYDIGYIMQEVEVNGPKASELYVYLKEKLPSPQGFVLTGNFTYFFADRRGKLIQRLNGNATYHELDDIIYQLL